MFCETFELDPDTIGPLLTERWLVLLTDKALGPQPPIESEFLTSGIGGTIELGEVLMHLQDPNTIGKTWGSGYDAAIFDKTQWQHCSIPRALDSIDINAVPSLAAERAAAHMANRQLSLFPQ